MPGFNGMGSRGEGPMTGGARGYCNPGRMGNDPAAGRGYGFGGGRGFGRGFGAGSGRGRGQGRGFAWRGAYPPAGGSGFGPYNNVPYGSPNAMRPEDEVGVLRDEAAALRNELDAIHKRIEQVEAQSSKTKEG